MALYPLIGSIGGFYLHQRTIDKNSPIRHNTSGISIIHKNLETVLIFIQASIEKCLQPSVPSCVDRNHYCSLPPPVPNNARLDEIFRPLQDWINFPDTKLKYYCPDRNWAFNYKTDPKAPSYYFTNNLNNITITCNKNG